MAKKRKIKNTRPRDTSKNRSRKDKKKSLMRTGSQNGAWKGGKSAHAVRRKVKAKPGEVVHHKDHNKNNTKTSNLQKVSKAKHNKLHPEKGRKSAKARRKKSRK
jgi:hypothetical protein